MNETILSKPDEQEFLKNYQPKDYPGFAYTADIVVFTIISGQLSLLLIKRGGYPYKGCWAIPGGFVEQTESSEDAALRELKEETGLTLDGIYFEQLKTYSQPDRDPRTRVISTAYVTFIPDLPVPVGGDDADEAHFFAVADILDGNESIDLSFDHETIIRDGLERVRSKLEYSPVATEFLPETFTLSDLRRVYESVWGENLHVSNFRRKVLSTPGFVEAADTKGESVFETGRLAQLYKKGDAKILHPAIMRKDD